MDPRSKLKAAKILASILYALAALNFIGGIVAYFVINEILENKVRDNVVVDKYNQARYNDWRDNIEASDPLYSRQFYVFNITNIDQVKQGQLPIFQQKGPYVYQYGLQYIEVIFKNDRRVVEYKIWERYFWKPEVSGPGLSEDDIVYQINPAYYALVAQTGTESNLNAVIFAGFMNNTLNSLNSSFIDNVVLSTLPVTILQFSRIKPNFFLEWVSANGTAFTIPNTPVTISNWTLIAPIITVVNTTYAQNLFDPGQPYSLTNPSQFGLWLQALRAQETAIFLQKHWNIPAPVQTVISAWMFKWLNSTNLHPTLLSLSFGGIHIADIPFLQWGTLEATGGAPLNVINSSIPFPIEYAAWVSFAANASSSIAPAFNVSMSRRIFLGNPPFNYGFMNFTETAIFIALYTAPTGPQYPLILRKYGFSQSEANGMYGYIQFILQNTLVAGINAGGGLWTRHSVRDFLFSYNDPVLALVRPGNSIVRVNMNYTFEEAKARLPESRYTGRYDIQNISRYITWRNSSVISFWNPPQEIFGTEGLYGPPEGYSNEKTGERNGSFALFSRDLWRSVYFVYNRTVKVKDIKTYEYLLDPRELLSATEYPPNAQFYLNIKGLQNLTLAELFPGVIGFPTFVSKPRFLDVDPAVNRQIRELLPNNQVAQGFSIIRSELDSYIRADVKTGVTLEARKRLQFNVEIQPQRFNVYNRGLQHRFHPVYWIDEGSILTDKQASDYDNSVRVLEDLALWLMICLFIVGGILLAIALAFTVWLLVNNV